MLTVAAVYQVGSRGREPWLVHLRSRRSQQQSWLLTDVGRGPCPSSRPTGLVSVHGQSSARGYASGLRLTLY